MFRSRKGRRASRLPCISLGFGDDRQSTSGSGDVSLTIFLITSVSGSVRLASFTNRFFHFSELPDFWMEFDAVERNEKLGHIYCQRSKESRAEERESRYFSAERH